MSLIQLTFDSFFRSFISSVFHNPNINNNVLHLVLFHIFYFFLFYDSYLNAYILLYSGLTKLNETNNLHDFTRQSEKTCKNKPEELIKDQYILILSTIFNSIIPNMYSPIHSVRIDSMPSDSISLRSRIVYSICGEKCVGVSLCVCLSVCVSCVNFCSLWTWMKVDITKLDNHVMKKCRNDFCIRLFIQLSYRK